MKQKIPTEELSVGFIKGPGGVKWSRHRSKSATTGARVFEKCRGLSTLCLKKKLQRRNFRITLGVAFGKKVEVADEINGF